MSLGATEAEWLHFAKVLSLSQDMVPCVPYSEHVKVLEGSAIEGKVGKIPSVFNEQGEAHGLKQWQSREILPEETKVWSQESRYNICVRTGTSGVYAIDVDVADKETADAIAADLAEWWPAGQPIEWRTRPNSEKFLVPFKMEARWPKRKFWLTENRKAGDPAVELLGVGQQFVAAGTHSSGVRYSWGGELPSVLPILSVPQAENLWIRLREKYSIGGDVQTAADTSTDSTTTSESTSSTAIETLTSIDDEGWAQLREALMSLRPLAADNDMWSEIGYALMSLKDTRDVRSLWIEFSLGAPNYEADAPERWYAAHASQVPRSDYRHIFKLARVQGWRHRLAPESFLNARSADQSLLPSGQGSPGGEAKFDVCRTDPSRPANPGKPVFRIEGGNAASLVDQAQDVLKPHVYEHAGKLVRAERRRLVNLSWAAIGIELDRRGYWEKYDGRKQEWVNCDCPDMFAIKFHGIGKWEKISSVDAIITSPFMREDGSICATPGYDERSRTIYQPTDTFPDVPAHPTRDDARAALERLTAPFDQFPFVNAAARSTFIAHILTEAARLSIDRAPMFWYTAQAAGSGKGLLADMASLIVHGEPPSRHPWPKSGDELRKVLYAALFGGERSIFFDNIDRGFKARSAELCAVLTSDWWSDRKLGVSEITAVRNRSVFSASGNNITPVGDLSRRSLVIRLVPEEGVRTFKIPNLSKYVRDHRPRLLIDALTILLAYSESQEQPAYATLPSFEEWSDTVLAPIIWLGLVNPLETQQAETDNEVNTAWVAFDLLGPALRGREFTSQDVVMLCGVDDKIHKALLESGCDEPHVAKRVGYWLRDNRDCINAGWRLIQGVNRIHGYYRWQFIRPDNGDLI